MKKANTIINKPIATMIASIIFAQAVPAVAKSLPRLQPLNQLNTENSSLAVIDQAAKMSKATLDLTGNIEMATTSLTDRLVQSGNLDAAKLTDWVKSKTGTNSKAFKNFQKIVADAQAEISFANSENLTDEELGEVIAHALRLNTAETLEWSGCAGTPVGVILIVAAVVVGIIALTKTRGEERIQRDYDDKRAVRTSKYNQDVAWTNNAVENIGTEIQALQGDIQHYQNLIGQAQTDIAFNLGVIAGSNDTETIQAAAANIDALQNKIQNYQNKIVNIQAEIATLQIEQQNYEDPNFVQAQLNNLTQQYNSDMAAFDVNEQNDLALVPREKALAKKLGIGAAAGLGAGIYLVIDGSRDC